MTKMINTPSNINKRKIFFSKEDFQYMKILALRFGVDITNYKKEAIRNRLAKHLMRLNVFSLDDYLSSLDDDKEEKIKFINIITNPTTAFFRENHHFEYLSQFLSQLEKRKKVIRIWSAGCSTGQEAYSIAIVARENIPLIDKYNFKILATDINSDSIYFAKKGLYRKSSLEEINRLRKYLWFTKTNKKEDLFEISPKLKKLIDFKVQNLIDWTPKYEKFDVIFCRNTLIYFKNELKKEVIEKLTKSLNMNGILVLGYSETLFACKKCYTPIGKTIYEKTREAT